VNTIEKVLGWAAFTLLSVAILIGPWFFGAKEMWWRWGFTTVLVLVALVSGVRLLFAGAASLWLERPRNLLAGKRSRPLLLLVAFVPFLVYAAVRCLQADVYMDAERSFLLFLLPVIVGVHIVFGFSRRQVRLLYLLIALDLFLLGAYALVNHAVTGSRLVLWVEGYPQYTNEVRATGTLFCPDHFSGLMELAICLGCGVLLARERRRAWRLGAITLCAVALAGVLLSKSRGGGLSVLVIAAAALTWGFHQWPRVVRWYARAGIVSVAAACFVLLFPLARGYVERFGSYFTAEAADGATTSRLQAIADKVARMPRGRMYGAAVRAWRTAPLWGIGPGMHQNLWPHFAATGDGDREAGKWPSLRNDGFHSYAVHNDWLQLAEEYGIVGLLLLLLPAGSLAWLLLADLHREARARRRVDWGEMGPGHHDLTLTAIFALVCMAFHSLGDFNLQMPAMTWLFAALLALPLAPMFAQGDDAEERERA
jgi:O-antigen ligase